MLWAGFYWFKNGISYTIKIDRDDIDQAVDKLEIFLNGKTKCLPKR
jgi:hypothetical protein